MTPLTRCASRLYTKLVGLEMDQEQYLTLTDAIKRLHDADQEIKQLRERVEKLEARVNNLQELS